eukprot:TRINITY_DN30408_c0_g1_i2.p1 TRINITY_DN30408_c0_g1~~TRINITY_DN30408_c0_g1_i2.p1  ORF type:complete len:179 (+),score=47.84 TRINITY_DN30408_c0_g1_i2:110-646(+)
MCIRDSNVMMRVFFFIKYYNFKAVNTSVIAENRYVVARGWTLIGFAGDTLTLIFIMLAFVQHFSENVDLLLLSWKRLLLGLAAFFNCVLLLSHFHNFPRFYLMAQAMTTALPHLGMYLVGIFPIFFGYSLCGVAVFGGMSDTFATAVSYTHLRAHETPEHLVCRLLLEKKKLYTMLRI